jgi:hypothetical protein
MNIIQSGRDNLVFLPFINGSNRHRSIIPAMEIPADCPYDEGSTFKLTWSHPMKSALKTVAIALAGALPFASGAEDLETDWIEPVAGFEESTLGARLKVMEISPVDGSATVTVAIPKSRLKDNDAVEEIIIYGKKPDKSEPVMTIPHEWIQDYSQDYYGLVLYLGKDGNIPFRIYLKGQESP